MKSTSLNDTRYGQLLAVVRPHLIYSDKDLEQFTNALLELDMIEDPTPEEREVADLLTAIVEHYQSETFRLRRAKPVELIRFLMEQQNLNPRDLEPVTGSKGTTSDILNGKRSIGVTMAIKLGQFFKTTPSYLSNGIVTVLHPKIVSWTLIDHQLAWA